MKEFKIGQIFEGTYPPEAARWCNANRAYMEELAPVTREEERQELVREEQYIEEQVIREEQYIEAEYDENGEVIKPAETIPAEIIPAEVIPAEYKTVTVDVTVRRFQIVAVPEPTEEEKARERIAELEAYLASTDWYAVRYAETGVAVPDDVKAARADARLEISALREVMA